MDANSWPWRITVTKTDGTSRTDDYAAADLPGQDPIGMARYLSTKPGVARVDVSTVFVAGEQVSPASV